MKQKWGNKIPTKISKEQFEKYFEPYLTIPKKGPKTKIPLWKIFNYILKVLYTGCQWKECPIEKDSTGISEIHYTSVFKKFALWSKDGSFEEAFKASIKELHNNGKLKTDILSGDGTNTVAKKGVNG